MSPTPLPHSQTYTHLHKVFLVILYRLNINIFHWYTKLPTFTK